MRKKDFVLWYLLKKGMAYVQEMYREWKERCFKVGHQAGTYDSFRVLINEMKKEGLIEVAKTEKTKWKFDRVYYRLTAKGLEVAKAKFA